MTKRTLPDFKQLADMVVDKAELPALLEEIYYKGYHAGKIDGEAAWQDELDKAYDNGYYHCYETLSNA